MDVRKIILKGKFGFTFIELVIVTAVFMILIVMALSVLNPKAQIGKSKDARRKADLKKIQTAFEDYYNDHNCYPTPPFVCGASFLPYLNRIPCDPDGGNYPYPLPAEPSPCPQFYRIYADFSNQTDPGVSEVGCQEGCGPIGDNLHDYGVSSSNVALEGSKKGTEPTVTGSGSQPTATTGPTVPPGSLYGCFSGDCQPIPIGTVCSPNYSPGCLGSCRNLNNEPVNECK